MNTHASEFASLDGGLEGGLSICANNRKSAVMMVMMGRIYASFARFVVWLLSALSAAVSLPEVPVAANDYGSVAGDHHGTCKRRGRENREI